jgi:hypothetical protein
MSTQVVVQGMLQADGTLELDEKVPMPAGRVLVTVQPMVQPPPNDPFWEMLKRIWAGQMVRGHVPPNSEQVEAQRQESRDEMEQEIAQAIRLQQECREARKTTPPAQDPGNDRLPAIQAPGFAPPGRRH